MSADVDCKESSLTQPHKDRGNGAVEIVASDWVYEGAHTHQNKYNRDWGPGFTL